MIDALENLYSQHRQGLYALAVAITGSHATAEDAVQNAFARLFKSQLPNEGDIVAYVYGAVRNSAIDANRSANRQLEFKQSLVNGYHPERTNGSLTPPDQLLTKERHERLRNEIESLSNEEREAIVLKVFAGLTFEQAAYVAQEPAKTIASRYRRALIKLERKLDDDFTS